jgi:hypothetical protein
MILLSFLLSSCSQAVKSIEIFSKPVEIAIVQPLAPTPIKLANISWKVLNVDDTIYYGLKVRDYEILSVNMLELKKYIKAQKNNLEYYKEVTGGNNETDAEATTVNTDP